MITSISGSTQRWILRRPGQTPAMRLFCFCYAGGNAAVYLPWQDALGRDVEVCAIQLPGRGARFGEPLLHDIDSAVCAIAHAITPLQDLPCVFFGHSLGALLAYELTHFLMLHQSALPRHLIVSGAQGPRLRQVKRQLHLLGDVELAEELARYAGTPAEVLANAELLSLVLPIVRADFRMAIEYAHRPRPALPVPITVFAGRDDEVDDPAQYEDWFRDSSVGAQLEWFDGGHFFINSATGSVLQRLRDIVDQTLAASAPSNAWCYQRM